MRSIAARVERVEDAIRIAAVLDAEFAQVAVFRTLDARGVRGAQGDALDLEQMNAIVDAVLFFLREAGPPGFKFVGVLDVT